MFSRLGRLLRAIIDIADVVVKSHVVKRPYSDEISLYRYKYGRLPSCHGLINGDWFKNAQEPVTQGDSSSNRLPAIAQQVGHRPPVPPIPTGLHFIANRWPARRALMTLPAPSPIRFLRRLDSGGG